MMEEVVTIAGRRRTWHVSPSGSSTSPARRESSPVEGARPTPTWAGMPESEDESDDEECAYMDRATASAGDEGGSPSLEPATSESAAWSRLMSCTALSEASSSTWYVGGSRELDMDAQLPVTPPTVSERGVRPAVTPERRVSNDEEDEARNGKEVWTVLLDAPSSQMPDR